MAQPVKGAATTKPVAKTRHTQGEFDTVVRRSTASLELEVQFM